MDGPGRVRALRLSKGKSLSQVALVAQCDVSTVSRVERALVAPQRATIAGIAKALRVAPQRLWEMAVADWEESTKIPEPVA